MVLFGNVADNMRENPTKMVVVLQVVFAALLIALGILEFAFQSTFDYEDTSQVPPSKMKILKDYKAVIWSMTMLTQGIGSGIYI